MANDKTQLGSSLPYFVAAFLLMQVWGFMAYETAQFQLLAAYENPVVWVFWASVILLVMVPLAALLTWRMKNRVILDDLSWEFREREVAIDEFKKMVHDYVRNYVHFISYWDLRFVLATILSAVLSIVAPFLLLWTNWIGITASPFVFGVMVVVFGILLTVTFYGGIPSDLSSDFPLPQTRRIMGETLDIRRIAGISWSGVRLKIGAYQGLYTMRDLRPTGRIEGIEGVARLEGAQTHTGNPIQVQAILEKKDGSLEKIGEASISDTLGLTRLVKGLLNAYCSDRGENELLEEVIEEVESAIAHLRRQEAS
jgi:hypothetical protein